MNHIEPEFNAILEDEQEDDFWMFLQLAERLDPKLALNLARRALAHNNPDIRELADEYARKWNGDAGTSPRP